MFKITAFLSGICLALCLMAPVALAQDAGAPPPDMGVSTPVDSPVSGTGIIQSAYAAAQRHDYRMLAAMVLVGIVYVTRKYGAKVPGKVGAFVASDRGGACIALGLAIIGGISHALLAAQPLGLAMLGTAVYISFLAAGGYSLFVKSGLSDLGKRILGKAGLMITLCAALGASGCAWLQAHPTVAAALHCAEDIAVEVLTVVGEAFAGGSVDWDAVGKAEAKYGLDAVICAAQKLAAPVTGAMTKERAAIQKGAQAYLSARGLQ